MPPRRWPDRFNSSWLARGILLLVLVLCIYWPCLHGTWLWDDADEIFANPLLRGSGGLGPIWRGEAGYDYYPLKTTFEWVLWRVWGPQVVCWHLLNISLHVVSAALLWRLLAKLGLRFAWIGALLFAIHPLAVESVAWMAEIKNTTSLPFALASSLAYLNFHATRRARYWWLAFLLFVAALLCKSAVVMLPVALVVMIWWREKAVRLRSVTNLLPWFGAAAIDGAITIAIQHRRAMSDGVTFAGDYADRIIQAVAALLFYAEKAIWPFDLMPVYSFWREGAWGPLLIGIAAALCAFGALLWFGRRAAFWGFVAGGAIFAAILAPILGLIAMPYLEFSWVADHYAYPALPVVAALLAAGLAIGWSRLAPRWHVPATVALAVMLAMWTFVSRTQAATYRSASAFWIHAYRLNPRAAIAEYELGKLHREAGHREEAIARFTAALERDALLINAQIQRAETYAELGRTTEAVAALKAAIAAAPNYAPGYIGLGNVLSAAGRDVEAKEAYERAIQLRPLSPAAHNNLGATLWRLGEKNAAAHEFETAARLDPTLTSAVTNLEIATEAPRPKAP